MASALKTVIRDRNPLTPQTEKAAKGQKKNHEGGYVFTVDAHERLKRFLLLGTEGTFYQSGESLALENARSIEKMIERADVGEAQAVIDTIVEYSVAGRAPKQQPGLFALALVIATTPHDEVKAYGYRKLNDVARTGTTLFEFAGFLGQFQRYGMGARKAFARWYTEKTPEQVAYQAAKYQSREGFSHRDILRISKRVKSSENPGLAPVLNWVTGEAQAIAALPPIIQGMEYAKLAESPGDIAQIVRQYGLTWEMVPSEALNHAEVWDALLDKMPIGALLRNLPKLTRLGLIAPLGGRTREIVARLTDREELKRGRIHPINVLIAMKTYSGGRSLRGSSTWTPVDRITDALGQAFYTAFDAVEPTDKRFLIGVDVSWSMGYDQVAGVPLTPAEVAAAMSLVTARTEPETHIVGFDHQVRDLGIRASMSLPEVMSNTRSRTFGGTDTGAAIRYALERGIQADVFFTITDNETWSGAGHTHQWLEKYRRETGIPAKMIVLATTATKFTVGDANDAGTLNLAGFDTAMPSIISEFVRG